MTSATADNRVSPVDMALGILLDHWRGGWDLLRVSGRDNANGIARDAKAKALRLGHQWHYMDVNEADDGPGTDHRLWCVTAGIGTFPRHPAHVAGALVHSHYLGEFGQEYHTETKWEKRRAAPKPRASRVVATRRELVGAQGGLFDG